MRRRGALIGVSAVVALGLGGTLAACADGGGRTGYVAVGAAGGSPSDPGHAVPPHGRVELVPLDGPGDGSTGPGGGASAHTGTSPGPGSSAGRGSSAGPGVGTGTSGTSGPGPTPSGAGSAAPSGSGPPPVPSPDAPLPSGPGKPGGGQGGSAPDAPGTPTPPDPGTPSAPAGPAGPAVLSVGTPSRAAGAHRWCENVTVRFRNTGGTEVTSGSVTFATHVIGLLGVDWATLTSRQPLPVPIGAGVEVERTFGVCVDAWRVPLGMHVETRSATATWS
ncbi:hypothetical protein ABR738_21310 [Streptomyces sp. Edi4]|uniref:hypothetical protein n=1 Tax=Streptomyces sp. Edi4 TaxID=3162527 RepID=UPI00330659C4